VAGKLSSVFNEGSLFKRTLLHVSTFLVGSVTFIAVMSFVLVSIAKGIAPSEPTSTSTSTSTSSSMAAKASASSAASGEANDDEPEAAAAPAGVPPMGMPGARGRFGPGRHPMRNKGRANMAGRNGAAAD
jgi:hypothetical protein